MKWVRAASLKQGESADIKDEWRQRIVDALEILNAEQQAMQTQLEGVCQAWEAANIELRSIGAQLGGINRGLEYLAGMAWKRYAVTLGGLVSRQGGSASEGVTRQEVGVGTSEEVAKDRGKGLSSLTAANKEKGKEKEMETEETLQEE